MVACCSSTRAPSDRTCACSSSRMATISDAEASGAHVALTVARGGAFGGGGSSRSAVGIEGSPCSPSGGG
eukprot:6206338-Prymnesium_polylepis.1